MCLDLLHSAECASSLFVRTLAATKADDLLEYYAQSSRHWYCFIQCQRVGDRYHDAVKTSLTGRREYEET
jgi:hypothetical protein